MALKSDKQKKTEIGTDNSDYHTAELVKYNHLEMKISYTNEEESKIHGRINKRNRCIGSLIGEIRLKNVLKNVKKKIYTTIIRPVCMDQRSSLETLKGRS